MKIKMKQIAGLCILLPALLSGCGNQASPQQAAASTAQPQASAQASPDAKQQGQNRPAMSQAQRQLFSTFQTLLMMDKAEGLAITKDQAQVMLPVAQDIETKAELSDENKTKLLEKLTDAQKKFIDDAASKMANRGNGDGNKGDGTRGNFNGQKGAKPDASGAPSSSASPNAAAGSDGANAGKQPRGNGGNGGNRPAGGNGGQMMKDPGKQLVELLQERVK
ncbi:hypothetical protein P5G65_13675 [Paenibacillus chondroitinus]|uniref:Lipoprotein n=1 Tax=Paenibacillus chondroitinus TaxID=59842 RepID=A0ABU6DB09_9BACL|nr:MULTISPECIES: hypothetical protein [Paenibacillus]MCY9657656.1 hypothetical protein [Paenibacillus anseongense]MEB4794950.1 hypothetical protein [Paenibacillus chondroitinus]